jgi:hypothetical protein
MRVQNDCLIFGPMTMIGEALHSHWLMTSNLGVAGGLSASRSGRKIGKQTWSHLRCEVLEEAAWLRDVAVPHLEQRQIVGAEAPVRHHLDKPAFVDESGLDDRGEIADPAAASSAGAKPS